MGRKVYRSHSSSEGLFLIFTETKLKGAFIVEPEKLEDSRGFFGRMWCREEFKAHGLNSRLVQCSISFNATGGTLRGMHYQIPPHEEAKLVRCTKGAIFDVIIDLRPGSPTFKQWVGENLTCNNHKMMYVPEGFAHGYQTLENNTELFYQMSELYAGECVRGVRWDDPIFGIKWPPVNSRIMSSRDKEFQDFGL